jgi:hypothetical protein
VRLSLLTRSGQEYLDASTVAWVLPMAEAELHSVPSLGWVGTARGVPVFVQAPVDGAKWLVLLQPNGDVFPGRPALEIDWSH